MVFKKTNISFNDTGLFSKAFIDYVEGNPTLKSFYEYPASIKSFGDAIKKLGAYEYSRKVLADTLKEYYKKNASGKTSEATLKNIAKLEDKNCFTITTGQQLCLFTGPLYFPFKIITAINLAEKLNKEYPANHFVPVFWMASEDHDYAEINHANVYGKKIEWKTESKDSPVGRLPLSDFQPTIDALFAIIDDEENGRELKRIITESYSSGKTLAEATFCFVNALFGKYGLVVIEPDNANLKKVFAPVITDELTNGNSFKLVSEATKKLVDIGIEPQVNPREINLFYINEQGRNRIEKKNEKFEIVNTDKGFTQDELMALIKKQPESFSPNVLLRPVYQQCILPNAAYIGGPAEIAYWLELKSVFTHYNIPYPVLMPRNSALIINKAIAQKIAKLKLDTKELFKNIDTLIKDTLKHNTAGLPDLEAVGGKLKEIYTALGKQVQVTDPTLVASTEAELQKQLNALKVLETKLIRVLKQKEETSVNQLRKLKDALFPGGELQERTDNFIPFYLQQGPAFFDMLKENFDPFEFSMIVLTEE